MNAPGEIAQLGEGFLGVLVGGADQHAGPVGVIVARRAPVQVLLDLPQGHGQRGQPDLGPVVQVALDPAQPGRRLVDGPGPPVLQLAGPLRRRRRSGPARHARLRPGRCAPPARRSTRAGSGRPSSRPAPRRPGLSRRGRRPRRRPFDEAGGWAGAQRVMATAVATRQTTRPVTEIRRGRWAASVYSSTGMTTSVAVGSRARTAGPPPPGCRPKATCAAAIAMAAVNAATG